MHATGWFAESGDKGNAFAHTMAYILRAGGQTVQDAWPTKNKTTNAAGYSALWALLEKAREIGVANLVVKSTSQLIVYQMMGVWKCRDVNLRRGYEHCRASARHFETIKFEVVGDSANDALRYARKSKRVMNPRRQK